MRRDSWKVTFHMSIVLSIVLFGWMIVRLVNVNTHISAFHHGSLLAISTDIIILACACLCLTYCIAYNVGHSDCSREEAKKRERIDQGNDALFDALNSIHKYSEEYNDLKHQAVSYKEKKLPIPKELKYKMDLAAVSFNTNWQAYSASFSKKMGDKTIEGGINWAKRLYEKELELRSIEQELSEREKAVNEVLGEYEKTHAAAKWVSDFELKPYDLAINYLVNKERPAFSTANQIKYLKAQSALHLSQFHEMKYRWDSLIQTFPELSKYVEDEAGFEYLIQQESLEEAETNYDHARDYLSKEEWDNLSTDERNQRALDNYINRPKGSWEIGIEYEMYIEYLLRKEGYHTIPHGSLYGLKDLGRDIIASKEENGNTQTLIIQCKRWSNTEGHEIHENTICQIFGTAMEYSLQHEKEIVVPIVYTTGRISDTARLFANKLNVDIRQTEMGTFPRIKCNINANGDQIYHLPFDQQYYATKIEYDGEFYAFTIKEATDAGFRRAHKHLI